MTGGDWTGGDGTGDDETGDATRLRCAIVPVTPFQQNCSILWDEASKVGMVVDPGGDVDRILAAVEQTGAAIEKIVLTHGHLDHAGGAAGLRDALRERLGRPVPIEGPDLRDRFLLDRIAEQATALGFEARNVTPDRWMAEGEVLALGPHRFDVLHCPGHTPGSLVFVNAAARFAVVGDVLFQGSVGRTDFPYGSRAALIAAIKTKLLPLGDDLSFVCGHGPGVDHRGGEGGQSIPALTAARDLGSPPPGQGCAFAFVEGLRRFSFDGAPTVAFEQAGLRYFVNAFWTAEQRRGHSLHEISYRACFKSQLPGFFIERLTEPGDLVFDPFSGRGTTAVQAALLGRAPAANDVNPLSAMLCAPRLDPPPVAEVRARLAGIDLSGGAGDPAEPDLLAFYHPDTLRQIRALRAYLLERGMPGRGIPERGVPERGVPERGVPERGGLDGVDRWIRMVAINRLSGHSNGFFSVYTMPPNQAVSAASQRKINAARGQVPPPRDVRAIILKKTLSLLADGAPPPHPPALLLTGAAEHTPGLADASVDLIVTSPPFLDVVDYAGDNWLRCWFAGIDAGRVRIDRHRDVPAWQGFVRRGFAEFARVVRPGGLVAFEVGEVRGGRVLLERYVAAAIEGLPFDVLGVMVNQQDFTKTANCWGVGNNRGGTNTNRIVMAVRR